MVYTFSPRTCVELLPLLSAVQITREFALIRPPDSSKEYGLEWKRKILAHHLQWCCRAMNDGSGLDHDSSGHNLVGSVIHDDTALLRRRYSPSHISWRRYKSQPSAKECCIHRGIILILNVLLIALTTSCI